MPVEQLENLGQTWLVEVESDLFQQVDREGHHTAVTAQNTLQGQGAGGQTTLDVETAHARSGSVVPLVRGEIVGFALAIQGIFAGEHLRDRGHGGELVNGGCAVLVGMRRHEVIVHGVSRLHGEHLLAATLKGQQHDMVDVNVALLECFLQRLEDSIVEVGDFHDIGFRIVVLKGPIGAFQGLTVVVLLEALGGARLPAAEPWGRVLR